MAPCSPSLVLARRSSCAALSGACIGSVAMPENPLRMLYDQPRDLSSFLDRRGGGRRRRLLVIEPGLRRHRQHMHVHLGGVHVFEPPLDVMAAARKWPVRHAGHLAERIGSASNGVSFQAEAWNSPSAGA